MMIWMTIKSKKSWRKNKQRGRPEATAQRESASKWPIIIRS